MVKLSIIEKKENTLLGRTEVKGTVSFEKATPSNTEVAAALAKELGHSIELVVVKHIHNQFSQRKAKFTAFAYKDKQTKTKTEPLTKHIKKKLEEEKKKADEAKAAENKKSE